jgi:hypothetical protein
LETNEQIFKEFVQGLSEYGKRTSCTDARYFWRGIGKDHVEQLLRDFKTHPWQLNFQGSAIADYIHSSSKLQEWDVLVAEGGETTEVELQCGTDRIFIKPEKRAISANNNQISISGTKVRVGAGGATKIGLDDVIKQKVKKKFFDVHPDKTNVPDKAYLEIERPPILILHVIFVDKTGTDSEGNPKSNIDTGFTVPNYLYALGVGIPNPDNTEEETAHYMVNMIELRNFYDFEEDEDE